MANQLSNDRLLAVLRAEGLQVREYAGWRDRCRCHSGSHQAGGPKIRSWEPINGVMVHITAGGLGGRSVETYIRDIINGDPSTPCKVQMVVDPSGVVWLNSGGRSNHAGTISSRALAAVQAGTLPLSGYQDLRGHDVDGNSSLYGIENISAGPPNPAQRDASVRICAAICRAYGWTGRDVIGHGEASDQRSYSDPGIDMGAFRRDVMARVAHTTATPTTTQPQEASMAGIDPSTIVYTDTRAQRVTAAQALEQGAWARDTLINPAGMIRVELDKMTAILEQQAARIAQLEQQAPAVAGQVDVGAVADAVAARLVLSTRPAPQA